jgi:hypothetical protein
VAGASDCVYNGIMFITCTDVALCVVICSAVALRLTCTAVAVVVSRRILICLL